MLKMLAVLALLPSLALAAVTVDSPYAAQSSEWLVTNNAGGSTLTNLAERKALLLQNLGPNALYCTFDGQAPLSTGALGFKIDPGATFSAAIGPSVTVKCIAASAAQVTTAATQVVELK